MGRDKGRLGLNIVFGETGVELTIWDDGPGIDETARVDSGLGQKLVEAFFLQLGGVLKRTSGHDGPRYVLSMPHSEVYR